MKPFKLVFLFAFILISSYTFSQETYIWEKLKTEAYAGKQDDIYFVDENIGWYINGFGKIFHTSDGGQNWVMQLEKKGTFFRCIAFIDSLNGFVGTVGTDYFPNVTDTIPLYRTTDGGKNWTPVSYSAKYVKGLCAIDIVKEEFINHGEIGYKYHIYAVGRVGTPANLMVSHDNGNTFTSMDMSKYSCSLYDIKMFNTKEGFACGSNVPELENSHATIIHTTDGGNTWQKVFESQRPYEISWKIAFPTKMVGYATIQSYNPDTNIALQLYIKTTNGGKDWTEYELCKDFRSRPFGVGFINESIGYIGTMNTGYQTVNGGKDWTKIDLGRACNKIRIVKTPNGKTYGYAIGVNVYKLKN